MLEHIGFVLFPNVTLLDFAGPMEVFGRLPGVTCHLIAETDTPVASDLGLLIQPTTTYTTCPKLDLILVPGGPGQIDQMDNPKTLQFLNSQGEHVQWITSVCTGSLLLGAAGLLKGYKATCHWSALGQLALFGATPTSDRVVFDRNRATGGGVTAGIDFALSLVQRVYSEEIAETIALGLEYNPSSPVVGGHPTRAPKAAMLLLQTMIQARTARRKTTSQRTAERLQEAL